MPDAPLTTKRITAIFVVFALCYLLSSLLRGVTATLAPQFVRDFALSPVELGLLSGAYFLGFALMQLPMGFWLDKYGVRWVLLCSLSLAALGSFLFYFASSFIGLLFARFLCGVGVSACLIAPLTAARLLVDARKQQSINAWMLMAGAAGLLAATLPVELIASRFGWHVPFFAVAALFVISIILIAWIVPKQTERNAINVHWHAGYSEIIRSRYLWKIGPLGFFNYAILVAIQTLWIGPWLTQVTGIKSYQAALALFWVNFIMLGVFFVMAIGIPKILQSNASVERVLVKHIPFGITLLFVISALGTQASWPWFALYCMACWVLALTHPLVGQQFSPQTAGRAIGFFNLLLFLGVFVTQWFVGWLVAALSIEHGLIVAYQTAFFILALLSLLSYLWFVGFEYIFQS